MGVLHGIRAFLPHIRAHGEGGHIVNTASMAGMLTGWQGFSHEQVQSLLRFALDLGFVVQDRIQ
jgi:NAD(P)-dependent dehydrogenase (short-subunit alcohol dehydrogenase family)